MSELLPVPYFHVVFTLPHQLTPFIKRDTSLLLGKLFHAASRTLMTFFENEEDLGVTPGILMVLHTWGQQLTPHYHVHCIVTGGGLDKQRQWKSCSADYLFPVKALSKVFRGIYLKSVKDLIAKEKVSHQANELSALVAKLYRHPWVVYAKKPFGGPEVVLKYLGRYTHRVAISNARIIRFSNNMVTFTYKDYRKDAKICHLTLPLNEFLLRFVNHILPAGFMRIRSYGLWSNPRKKKDLAHCRSLLGKPDLSNEVVAHEIESSEEIEGVLDVEDLEPGQMICPHCRKNILLPMDLIFETVLRDTS